MNARFIVGDVRDVLATLPDASVDLVFTSPPFLALRSYLPADHPDKGREIGSEPDPGAFIDTLLGVTEDLARVLAPHGSLCVELGDTYSGSGGAGGDYAANGLRDGQPEFQGSAARNSEGYGSFAGGKRNRNGSQGGTGWPMAKSACLIPEIYRLSLAYGRNPLTGRETPRWRVRNTVRWCRPNPPVGALGDKFRPATSEIVVACKAKDRYFDLDAVRTEHKPRGGEFGKVRNPDDWTIDDGGNFRGAGRGVREHMEPNPAGAPPLDWWKIPTHGYPGAHYATFPSVLVTIPLLAMCPERVCTECGQPSRRLVNVERVAEADDSQRRTKASEYRLNAHDHPPEIGWEMEHTTLGWTDCGHDAWRPGVVLDPFGGSGTVAIVATGHGRDAILIDIDHRNADLARERVGMFLTVDEPLEPVA